MISKPLLFLIALHVNCQSPVESGIATHLGSFLCCATYFAVGCVRQNFKARRWNIAVTGLADPVCSFLNLIKCVLDFPQFFVICTSDFKGEAVVIGVTSLVRIIRRCCVGALAMILKFAADTVNQLFALGKQMLTNNISLTLGQLTYWDFRGCFSFTCGPLGFAEPGARRNRD